MYHCALCLPLMYLCMCSTTTFVAKNQRIHTTQNGKVMSSSTRRSQPIYSSKGAGKSRAGTSFDTQLYRPDFRTVQLDELTPSGLYFLIQLDLYYIFSMICSIQCAVLDVCTQSTVCHREMYLLIPNLEKIFFLPFVNKHGFSLLISL